MPQTFSGLYEVKMIQNRICGFVFLIALSLLGAACSHRECPAVAEETAEPAKLPYYSFFAPNPEKGYCEKQVFGSRPIAEEPTSVILSIAVFLLGMLGLFRSRRTTMVFQVLFGMLAGWGIFAAVYHVWLINGFFRMVDFTLSVTQSFTIIMLFHSLYIYRIKTKGEPKGLNGWRIASAAFTFVFTIYPAVVHVVGVSSANPWVAWLVFDLLWALIAGLLIAIWFRRDKWPGAPPNAKVFNFVWYAIGFCTLAYACWCVDKFLCTCETPWLAYLHLHGWWHFFMGLCLYYMINLCRYFSAGEYGYVGSLQRFPAKGPFGISIVEWNERP